MQWGCLSWKVVMRHAAHMQVVKCLREYVKWAEGFAARALRRISAQQKQASRQGE